MKLSHIHPLVILILPPIVGSVAGVIIGTILFDIIYPIRPTNMGYDWGDGQFAYVVFGFLIGALTGLLLGVFGMVWANQRKDD